MTGQLCSRGVCFAMQHKLCYPRKQVQCSGAIKATAAPKQLPSYPSHAMPLCMLKLLQSAQHLNATKAHRISTLLQRLPVLFACRRMLCCKAVAISVHQSAVQAFSAAALLARCLLAA